MHPFHSSINNSENLFSKAFKSFYAEKNKNKSNETLSTELPSHFETLVEPSYTFPDLKGANFLKLPSIDLSQWISTVNSPISCPSSQFRTVFQTSETMKKEFVKFLKTIFYQLDDKKVLNLMQEILNDPNKTDDEIYSDLLNRINETKKRLPFLSQLWSLSVLKNGLGKQICQIMQKFAPKKFQNYAEIYDRRYLNTIRKMVKMPFKGNTIAISDNHVVRLGQRIEAGALLSCYPYKQHVPLNDRDCKDPLLEPEKTATPISNEVPDNSVDFIACLGGLHHMPTDRVESFVDSMHAKLKPGGVIIQRDHNVGDHVGSANLKRHELYAMASVVHSFVNAAGGVSLEAEKKELRHFKSVDEWTNLMENHGFTRISKDTLVLKDDPTENAMFAFVKSPQNLAELEQTISYRNDCSRVPEGTRATWIEWGNVRYSKQYAEFVQNHHAFAFDNIGHMRQHWTHFYHFVKESVMDNRFSLKHLLTSDAFLMNLFIVIGTSLECSLTALTNLPSQVIARCKNGKNWRDVSNLTDLEKLEAKFAAQYARDLDTIPFYMQSHISKIKQIWATLWNSKEGLLTKLACLPSAISSSLRHTAMSTVSLPLRAIYTQDKFKEAETVKMIVKDPDNELEQVIQQWERNKDPKVDFNRKIELVHATPDRYKLVSIPRYQAFTKIFKYIDQLKNFEVYKIGGQTEITIDIISEKDSKDPQITQARKIYELESLQDPTNKKYVTYQINVSALKKFQEIVGTESMYYIHE